MDPITITAGALTISKLAGTLTVTLPSVWRTYSTAQDQLDDIVSLLLSLKIATTALSATLPLELDGDASTDNDELGQADRDLQSAVRINLNGCATLLKELSGQIDLVTGLDSKLTKLRKTKYLWKKADLDQLEGRLDRRVNALNLILNILANPARRVEVFSSNNRDTCELRSDADEVSLYSKADDLAIVAKAVETRFALAPVAEEKESSAKAGRTVSVRPIPTQAIESRKSTTPTRTISTRPIPTPAIESEKNPKPIPVKKETAGENPRSVSRLSAGSWTQKFNVLPFRGSSSNGLRVKEKSTITRKADWWPDATNPPSPLATAISHRDFKAIRRAFQAGANPRETVSWPLFAKLETCSSDLHTLRMLDPVGLAVIHLHWLAPQIDPGIVCDMIDLLFEYGAVIDNSMFPLRDKSFCSLAVAMNLDSSGKVVHNLIRRAVQPIITDTKHEWFYYACQSMNLNAIIALSEEDWNLTSRPLNQFHTPLHIVARSTFLWPLGGDRAEYQQFREIAELLVRGNAKINPLCAFGSSPIAFAIRSIFRHRCPSRVAWFLEHGASKKPDGKGNTLFHHLGDVLPNRMSTEEEELAREVHNILVDAGVEHPQGDNNFSIFSLKQLKFKD
ncbi:hypothetical protein IQ07DRAFT_590094 [Pyrenochaeta sp. DS3sAY3a]|nr:hypothetical protein IQ07DRAFT_590094 [Pyrenochaeta sp. DS3sAY3a]